MLIYDSRTRLPIADNEIDPFAGQMPTVTEIQKSLDSMILSASGWRKVFAISKDEEDFTPVIAQSDAILIAYAALILSSYIKEHSKEPSVLIGIDARPTGPIIAEMAIRMFLSQKIQVHYLFIAAAPEIMADNLRNSEGGDAFFYISASHNPVGHNGIKFGAKGGVFNGTITSVFADKLRTMVKDKRNIDLVQELSASVTDEQMLQVLLDVDVQKTRALKYYQDFVLETGSTTLEELKNAIVANPLGIVAEFNGSARCNSIDIPFLKKISVVLNTLNDKPGEIVHAIVPEGGNLELCRKTVESKHKENTIFNFGYVPDNDGDRGNIVVMDNILRKAVILEAQEVFALVTMVTLSEMRLKNPDARLAIAVNGPTSLRIDRIAEVFDCKVFRSEVGEANVVELAQKLRDEGYLVKILGEGSNGGNITYPAKVRDPMNTIVTLLKLLGKSELYTYWCRQNKQDVPRKVTIGAALRSLPVFTTTGAFSAEGKMQVHQEPGKLKSNYEKLFLLQWEERKEYLRQQFGLYGYVVYQTEGINCLTGMGEKFRHAPYKGGFKICFTDKYDMECAFMWMRPSGTEPVFRVLVDSEGESQVRHDYLLSWHRSLIEQADKP
ncbi:MAG: phosphoglucomutase [Sphaerochaetaceae bacterium]